MNTNSEELVDRVRERYAGIALKAKAAGEAGDPLKPSCCGPSCCGADADATTMAKELGYSEADLEKAGEANLGLGCGNPLALARIRPGMTVLDLGSGAGFDALLAADRVGPGGRVIGVDMTSEMVSQARKNAAARGAANVEFRAGRLEALPVDDASVDLVLSNCVINLVPDKERVFTEIARVLRPGGTIAVSDLALLAPLPESIRGDVEAHVGCIAGASSLGDYPAYLLASGFVDVAIPHLASAALMVEGFSTGKPRADVQAAARALVSAVFVGRKPAS